MAYTKSPVVSTYSTERVDLTREINTRTGGLVTKDEDYINVFMEIEKNRTVGDSRSFIVKRSGSAQLVASVASSDVRGMYYWADQDKLFYAVGQDIIIYTVASGASTTLSAAFSTTTGAVGFTEFLYDTGSVVIIATDGTTLLSVDSSNTKVVCTDPDMPVHYPYPVFLDGYLFLAKVNTSEVYNSNLNDPMAWTAGDVLTAEMEPDLVVRICKINNYLVVFGRESIEYFWDAGIATGTPMQRNDTPVKFNGYIGGFAQYGNQIFFIGKNASGQPDVFSMKDFKCDSVGSASISRYLNSVTTNYSTWKAALLATQGHNFYLMNVGTYTYVLDVEGQLWYRWQWQQTASFPVVASSSATSVNKFYPFFALSGTSAIYSLQETVFQDNGVDFTAQITTEASDFGTMNRKTMHRLSIIGDRPPSSGIVKLSWSDDDYKSFTTTRDVEMDQDLPCTYNLGSFRQRIFKMAYTNNSLWRIQNLEVNINKGNS